jgi:HTH-type transcriptional regulator, transcriptional repressor of NAD biosynthesis genes
MRELVSISGTKIRENPYQHWDYLPEVVRPCFVKKVCIFGPESTGKSTLTKKLAEHFHTSYVHEYARPFLDLKNGECKAEDIEKIAR